MIGTDKKLLLIDDEPGLRLSLRDYFEDCGFTVYEAIDGENGIEQFREIKPDIALIDLKMPGMGGIEAIKILHNEFPETPLIVVSGTGIIEDAIEAIRNGAWDYVSKPIRDMLELEHVIEMSFEKSALIKDNKRYQNELEDLVEDRTIELQNTNKDLFLLNKRLHEVVEITSSLQGFDRIENFGKYLLEKFGTHMNASGGSLYLCRREGLKLVHSFNSESLPGFIKYPLKDDSILSRALSTSEPQIAKDMEEEEILKKNGLPVSVDGSYLVFPLTDSNRKNVGILTIHKKSKPYLMDQDKEIGTILSSFSSEAIRAISFVEDIRKREQYFKILAKGIGGSSDQAFFDSIVRSCVSIFETEYAFLGRIEGDRLNSVSYIDNGQLRSSFGFDISGSVAELVLKEGSYQYKDKVGLLPDRSELSSLDIKSYIGFAIKDNNGDPIGILCTFSRYTMNYPDDWSEILELMASKYSSVIDLVNADKEKARLRENLQQAQKMEAIGTLAGGIAHDFNNILSPILGYSEMILYSVPEDNELRSDIEQIKNAGIRAKDLVQQILSFSRQKEVKAKAVEIQIIVREVVRMLKSTLPATIKIEQTIKKDCFPVYADPTQIHQVVMNLCTNSFHAMEENGGVLTVTTENTEVASDPLEPATRYVKLVVKDTGVGMAPDMVERIFEPYFTTKKEGKGTGLGLSVAHGIVSSCGGFIDIESEKNVGTTFSVYLPVAEAFQVDAVQKEEEKIQQGSENIMLVDDQVPILKVLGNVLGGLGYKVTSFSDPLEAFKSFEEAPENYDMIITDQTMPNLTGDKLSEKIFAINSEFPVILCTGYSSIMTKEKAYALGIRAFLAKPIEMNELASTIRGIFDS
jgi:signal transduction histidine kinase/DNA-binding response OmpR family regulator